MLNNFDLLKECDAGVAEEIYTKVIRAGRRTYFFDVKATRGDDYFLTITESRRMAGKDGLPYYEKHKIHLYKEDFEKYMHGLGDAISYIKNTKPQFFREMENDVEVNMYALAMEEELTGV